MKQRFVLLVDGAKVDERDAITAFIKGKFGFWHHFSDTWLLTSNNADWDTPKIREAVRALTNSNVLVLKVDLPAEAPRWSGRAPTKMFDWLKKSWISD